MSRHPEHFGERHGLFVIIALGETLIVAASGVTGAPWSGHLVPVAILAVIITCGLWWSYFVRIKPMLDSALESSRGAEQSMMARDVYSLVHFPVICGIIAYAVAVEAAIAHPVDPLPLYSRVALAVGLALFVGGMAVAAWRATRRTLLLRITITAATVIALVAVTGVTPLITLTIAFVGIAAIVVLEQWMLASGADVHGETQ